MNIKAVPFMIIVAVLIAAMGAHAEPAPPRLLADSGSQVIRGSLAPLLPISRAQLERFDADIGIVLSRRVIVTDKESHATYDDRVWLVRRGHAEKLSNYVQDFNPATWIKKVRAYVIHPGDFDTPDPLQAKIEFLDRARIHITQGDGEGRRPNLVIGFDQVGPGDLVGISVLTTRKGPLGWYTWLLGEEEPVARAELRMKTGPKIAYVLFGSRLRDDQVNREVLAAADGQKTDVRIWADNITPVLSEPFSPPRPLQSPQFTMAMRAMRIRGRFFTLNDWNGLARNLADREQAYLKQSGKAVEKAREMTGGLDAVPAADSLYHFVRDDLLAVDSGFYSSDKDARTVDRILSGRSGSQIEKAFLLLAMLKGIGAKAEMVWVHDPAAGSFFPDYPSLLQVTIPMVRLTAAGNGRWYDLGCRTCQPDQIRAVLQDAEALTYRSDASSLDRDLWDEAGRSARGSKNIVEMTISHYRRKLKTKSWTSLFKTPGVKGRWGSWYDEDLVLRSTDGDSLEAAMVLRSMGKTSVQIRLGKSGSRGEAIKKWVASRYESFRGVTVRPRESTAIDTLVLRLDASCDPLPPPMGNTWILPPEVVFGNPLVGPWPQPRVTPFYVPLNMHSHWRLRLPLPDGWEGVAVPGNKIINADRLLYKLVFSVQGGYLVVDRTLIAEAGTVRDEDRLARIGNSLDGLNRLETTSIVLHKDQGQP